jgi:hypothetical protein
VIMVGGTPGPATSVTSEKNGRKITYTSVYNPYLLYLSSKEASAADVGVFFNFRPHTMSNEVSRSIHALADSPTPAKILLTAYTENEAIAGVEQVKKTITTDQSATSAKNPYRSDVPQRNMYEEHINPLVYSNQYLCLLQPNK